MATLQSFQARIRRRARQLPLAAGELVDTVALGIVGALTEGTPVDTQLARSNWIVRRGSPDLSVRAPRSAEDTFGEAAATLATGRTGEGEEVHIANGGDKVPYLSLLDAGSSQQAPAGFIRAAVTVGIGIARKALLLKDGTRFTARRR